MPAEKPKKRYASYTRAARHDPAAQRSLAAQDAAIARFVQHNGGAIVDKFQDVGFSANDDQRPAFQQLMRTATHPDKPFDAILVTSHTRLARNRRQLVECLKVLDAHGVKIISIGHHNSAIRSFSCAAAAVEDRIESFQSNNQENPDRDNG